MLQRLFQIIILRHNSSNDCLYFTTFARVVERILIMFIIYYLSFTLSRIFWFTVDVQGKTDQNARN
jgi:hypothetical protein